MCVILIPSLLTLLSVCLIFSPLSYPFLLHEDHVFFILWRMSRNFLNLFLVIYMPFLKWRALSRLSLVNGQVGQLGLMHCWEHLVRPPAECGPQAQVLKHGSAGLGDLVSCHLSLVLWLAEEMEYILHVLSVEIFQLHSLFWSSHSTNTYRVLFHAGWFPVLGLANTGVSKLDDTPHGTYMIVLKADCKPLYTWMWSFS